ncbi:MAG: hypothetical protein ACNS63_12275 [Candidatus Nitrospinota bacterium M3_3B_026]
MRHLKTVELLAFADPSFKDKERAGAREHLEQCEKCRSAYISLMTLRSAMRALPESVERFEPSEGCVPVELMGDFLGGRLPAASGEAFSSHVAECDACFERAAWFTRSTVRMTEGVLRMSPTPERFKRAVAPDAAAATSAAEAASLSWRGAVLRWVRSPIPAYAFAASLILFLLFWPGGQKGVVDIGSDAVYSIYERPERIGPAFGFADSGRKIDEAPAGLMVNESLTGLSFRWAPVEGAEEYSLVLTELGGEAEKVYKTKTALPEASIPTGAISANRAYTWKVTAETDGGIYITSGRFVYLD